MIEVSNASPSTENVVDQAADAASDAVNSARALAALSMDRAQTTIESVRQSISPYVDKVVAYTRDEPIKALAWALCAGFVSKAVHGAGRRR